MQKSERKILTTHVGSLPRNPALTDLLLRQGAGEPVDPAAFQCTVAVAVDEVVRRQLEAGIDIGNDGEQPRVAFPLMSPGGCGASAGRATAPSCKTWRSFPTTRR